VREIDTRSLTQPREALGKGALSRCGLRRAGDCDEHREPYRSRRTRADMGSARESGASDPLVWPWGVRGDHQLIQDGPPQVLQRAYARAFSDTCDERVREPLPGEQCADDLRWPSLDTDTLSQPRDASTLSELGGVL
jgi:hypothetical protein